MQPIAIRTIRPEDWALWRDLRLQALSDCPDAFGQTLSAVEALQDSDWVRHAQEASKLDRHVLIAEHDDEPIGMAVVHISPDDPSRADLYAMWVKPSARRAGAGRALVDEAITWAEQNGVLSLTLQVTEGNRAAEALYRDVGFSDTGQREPLRPGSSIQTMVMALRLPRNDAI